ncbi:hypothetical protein [Trichormus sp. NMC-1]|nr:hypothetical protein [Trichormus sp. NMC-1]
MKTLGFILKFNAKQDARDEMGKKPEIIALSWDEVFEEIYTLWED